MVLVATPNPEQRAVHRAAPCSTITTETNGPRPSRSQPPSEFRFLSTATKHTNFDWRTGHLPVEYPATSNGDSENDFSAFPNAVDCEDWDTDSNDEPMDTPPASPPPETASFHLTKGTSAASDSQDRLRRLANQLGRKHKRAPNRLTHQNMFPRLEDRRARGRTVGSVPSSAVEREPLSRCDTLPSNAESSPEDESSSSASGYPSVLSPALGFCHSPRHSTSTCDTIASVFGGPSPCVSRRESM